MGCLFCSLALSWTHSNIQPQLGAALGLIVFPCSLNVLSMIMRMKKRERITGKLGKETEHTLSAKVNVRTVLQQKKTDEKFRKSLEL